MRSRTESSCINTPIRLPVSTADSADRRASFIKPLRDDKAAVITELPLVASHIWMMYHHIRSGRSKMEFPAMPRGSLVRRLGERMNQNYSKAVNRLLMRVTRRAEKATPDYLARTFVPVEPIPSLWQFLIIRSSMGDAERKILTF